MKYFTRPEASGYLNSQGIPCTTKSLQKFACVGGGPKYYKFGNRALYKPAHLDEWVVQKLGEPLESTSDMAMQP